MSVETFNNLSFMQYISPLSVCEKLRRKLFMSNDIRSSILAVLRWSTSGRRATVENPVIHLDGAKREGETDSE